MALATLKYTKTTTHIQHQGLLRKESTGEAQELGSDWASSVHVKDKVLEQQLDNSGVTRSKDVV